jgi:hypothetical protein
MDKIPDDFDYKLYLLLNPDLETHKVNTKALAIKHYLLFGKQEQRPYKLIKLIDVDKDFDEKFYLEEYPDTATYYASKTNISLKEKLFHHYVNYGKNEGRFKNKTEQDNSFIDTSNILSNVINNIELVNPINKLECICLMTTEKEIINGKFDQFVKHLISKTPINKLSKQISFKIVINNLQQDLEISQLNKIFQNVDIINLKLSPNEDIYLGSLPKNKELPHYGLKSGPNITFFKSIELCKTYNTSLFLETDCILNTNWLNKINLYIKSANGFLISGATYDGVVFSKAGSAMMNHINGGTAMYATSNYIFQIIIGLLSRFLHEQIHFNSPGLAYDYALKILIDNNLNNYALDYKTRELWQFINRNYIPTKLVINCSTKKDTNLNVETLSKKYDFAILHKKTKE